MDPKSAVLALEDGRVFAGRRFGASTDTGGEVVFNTSMTGYQEIISDPSYAGQMVVMTYPMMGNYGITPEDFESRRPFLAGLIVKEASRLASNWRHERTLDTYLADNGIPGLAGLDTRALVRHLRSRGVMRGVIGSPAVGADALVARARAVPSMLGQDLASVVSEGRTYKWERPSLEMLGRSASGSNDGTENSRARSEQSPSTRAFHVVAYDFGIKRNILRRLVDVGGRVTVVPAKTAASEVLALKPDGVVLSNGPGDPEPLDWAVANTRALIGRVPVLGICLGHQILALACGAKTYKMKFGHRGGNHPVMDLSTGKVEITSHNHGFTVDPDRLNRKDVEVTHVDLNDQTVEGLRLVHAPAMSVQYHPEAAPGPHDASHIFVRFAAMMRDWPRERS
ncbi:MAG: glutamine-hydrolyzing carbamoyl-phosphate synthase small subunit [Deltaproteobacteria bacterium]|nr:glutamine-hydrolyzing carbamoyl-phosphate synthase small subunit [Deltaproteobacteria bacterium]